MQALGVDSKPGKKNSKAEQAEGDNPVRMLSQCKQSHRENQQTKDTCNQPVQRVAHDSGCWASSSSLSYVVAASGESCTTPMLP
jgi:hypothetical protein